MHCIVVPTREDIHVIRVLAVLPRSLRRHLQIEAIKDALTVVCLLQLHVGVKVMLDPQILHKVLRLAKIPHLDIQVVATSQQGRPWMLDEARTCNRVDNL